MMVHVAWYCWLFVDVCWLLVVGFVFVVVYRCCLLLVVCFVVRGS